MARYRGTTTQRGLGSAHAADRKRLLLLHRDGDPCWRCGQPMFKWQELDRDHVVDRVLGGTDGPAVLAHASCNRSAGARLSNQVRPQRVMAGNTEGRDTICRSCGKRYWYAARLCEICGAHYHPHRSVQRSCSRKCGVELRRRIYGHAGGKVAKPKPPCENCGKPCDTVRRFCGNTCADEAREAARQAWPVTPIAYYACRYCGKLGVMRASGKPGHGQREVCPARDCQLLRLMANNLRVRKGMTREQADAAVAAYRAQGDHRKLRGGPQWAARRRRPVAPSGGLHQDTLW